MRKSFLFFLLTIPFFGFSQLSVEFEQITIGCSSGCFSTVKATGIGGVPPYTYDWKTAELDPGDASTAINLCGGYYDFTIFDDNGDRKDTTVFVEMHKSPKVEINLSPGDTLYIQNPTGQFSFDNPDYETNPVLDWLWDFGDGNTADIESPIHTYTNVQEYYATLQISYADNCDTLFVHPLAVKTVHLFRPNVITPNGDGINDVFIITDYAEVSSGGSGDTFKSSNQSEYPLINDFYISNELVIFNRWGKKVHEAKNYNNDWDGDNLPDGVYFYVLKCKGKFEDDTFKGSIHIIGGNN